MSDEPWGIIVSRRLHLTAPSSLEPICGDYRVKEVQAAQVEINRTASWSDPRSRAIFGPAAGRAVCLNCIRGARTIADVLGRKAENAEAHNGRLR